MLLYTSSQSSHGYDTARGGEEGGQGGELEDDGGQSRAIEHYARFKIAIHDLLCLPDCQPHDCMEAPAMAQGHADAPRRP